MNTKKKIRTEPVLCYVKGPWAYFTTQELSKQTGDGWDDAPYEDNASPPYESKDGSWTITKVAWDGPFQTLYEYNSCYVGSRLSVNQINSGEDPWLRTSRYESDWEGPPIKIMAETTLSEFIRIIESAGGFVYLKRN